MRCFYLLLLLAAVPLLCAAQQIDAVAAVRPDADAATADDSPQSTNRRASHAEESRLPEQRHGGNGCGAAIRADAGEETAVYEYGARYLYPRLPHSVIQRWRAYFQDAM